MNLDVKSVIGFEVSSKLFDPAEDLVEVLRGETVLCCQVFLDSEDLLMRGVLLDRGEVRVLCVFSVFSLLK